MNITLRQAAAEYAKTAFDEVTADPLAYGIGRQWTSVAEWIDYEMEGDDVYSLMRRFGVSYYVAREVFMEELNDIATLEKLNAPWKCRRTMAS